MIAVIFTSQRTKYTEGYSDFNEKLEAIANNMSGFIKQESVRQENGFGISISYWENMESAKEFKQIPLHIEAQQKGKTHYYEWYDVKVCAVNKHYTFNIKN
ncbi:MAG: antibiotic biosynthesis monooxygenase [Chitinophagales bacterium]|nr:antibiotic biosynthesis monooxygenase [Chitinophagales bacterium]